MSNMSKFLKQHALKYYSFYALAFPVLLPIWLQLLVLSLYRNINAIILLGFMFLGIMFISLAATLKHLKPQFKMSNRLTLLVGLIIQLLCLYMLYKNILAEFDPDALTFTIISILMSALWLIMYSIDLADLDIAKAKMVGKKAAKYFILSAVLLFGSNFILGRYFMQKINNILELPVKVKVIGGKINYAEIESQLYLKLFEAKLLLFVVTLSALMLFFIFYKKVVKEVGSDPHFQNHFEG